jgi:hypothetical protein
MKAGRAACSLCGSYSELRDSHIIPEFMYASLYDDKHKMVSYRYGEHRITKQPLQKGLWEPLLCGECEGYLNRNFEQPNIERWTRLSEIPPRKDGATVSIVNGDYTSFKLLLLSILWRASVAARPEFHKVRLGPHEDRIRQMLLSLEPGEETQYPCQVILFNRPTTAILFPHRIKVDGHTVYSLVLGQIQVLYFVSGHIKEVLPDGASLRKDGSVVVRFEDPRNGLYRTLLEIDKVAVPSKRVQRRHRLLAHNSGHQTDG